MYIFGAQMYRNAVLLKSSNTNMLALVAQYLHDETKLYTIMSFLYNPKYSQLRRMNKCTFILKV